MDDVTSLLPTGACTVRFLKKFEELLTWARMKIKPSKSRSLNSQRNQLQRSITLGYRQEKGRLVLQLRDSSDPSVRDTKAPVQMGCKWRAEDGVDQTISRLRHHKIVGRIQSGRTGLGWRIAPRFWSKASRKERRELSGRAEGEHYNIIVLSQQQQGC